MLGFYIRRTYKDFHQIILKQEMKVTEYCEVYSKEITDKYEELKSQLVELNKEIQNNTLLSQNDQIDKIKNIISKFDLKTNLVKQVKQNATSFMQTILDESGKTLENEQTNIIKQIFDDLVKVSKNTIAENQHQLKQELKKKINKGIQEIIKSIDENVKKEKEERCKEIKLYFNKVRICANKLLQENFKVRGIIWFDKSDDTNTKNKFTSVASKQCPDLEVKIFSTIDDLRNYLATVDKRMILISNDTVSFNELDNVCSKCPYITNILNEQNMKICSNADTALKNVLKEIAKIETTPTVQWVAPLVLSNLPKNIFKYLDHEEFRFKSFKDIPTDKKSYDGILELYSYASSSIDEFLNILRNDKTKADGILRLYTAESPFYRTLNQSLSELDDNKITKFANWIKAVNLALKEYDDNEGDTKYVLYRGVPFNGDYSKFIDFLKSYKAGTAIMFPAFTSTSSDTNVAKRFGGSGVLYEIFYEKKKESNRPKNVEKVSCFGNEKEYLFHSFSRFIVKECSLDPKRPSCKITLENLD